MKKSDERRCSDKMEVSRMQLQTLTMLVASILEEQPVKKQAGRKLYAVKIEPATQAENERARELMHRIP